MTVIDMQAAADRAADARAIAGKEFNSGFPYQSQHAQSVAAAKLPSKRVRLGQVECEALIPENRMTYRRPHYRYVWWVDGKRASVKAAAMILGE